MTASRLVLVANSGYVLGRDTGKWRWSSAGVSSWSSAG